MCGTLTSLLPHAARLHRYTQAEVQKLYSNRKLAANNNTNSQYGYLYNHLEVRPAAGAAAPTPFISCHQSCLQ